MTKIVCIGDTHAHPDYDNKRFQVLGQFCAEEQPDYIVQIGDWSDMTSFNSHGTKLEHEGTRWKYDVEVTLDSLHEFEKPIRRRKRKMPRKVITLGNHEHRINRWPQREPESNRACERGDAGLREVRLDSLPVRERNGDSRF